MILWWIGAVVLLVVVVPVVALVLHRLLRPALAIKHYADDIDEFVGRFPGNVDATVAELAQTRRLVAAARPELERYGHALEGLL